MIQKAKSCGMSLRIAQKIPTLVRAEGKGPVYLCSLIILFVLSFAVPVFSLLSVTGVVSFSSKDQKRESDLFVTTTAITQPYQFIEVAETENIELTADKDFLAYGWFRINQLPAKNERVVLFSKYDANIAPHSGYALGLFRDGKRIRPTVYWKNSSGEGGWRLFSEITLKKKEWVFLGMSFRNASLLGVHAATKSSKKKSSYILSHLGGFDLEEMEIPESDASLKFGSVGSGTFRGKIGPFGVVNDRGLSTNLTEILQSLIQDPEKKDIDSLDYQFVLYSIDGKNDNSGFQHKLSFQESPSVRKKRKNGKE